MAGLLRVTIINNLPATKAELHRRINANNESIDAMLDKLVDDGKLVRTAEKGKSIVYMTAVQARMRQVPA